MTPRLSVRIKLIKVIINRYDACMILLVTKSQSGLIYKFN